ncbi:MAG TPA: hypothetical protein VLB49_17635, partial [Gemmatimonadales bacterium]|nr:hypothetical protein [Gemmatimonadales bacterium]
GASARKGVGVRVSPRAPHHADQVEPKAFTLALEVAMRRLAGLLLVAALGASPTLPGQEAQSLRGVWQRIEAVVNKGPNAGRHTTDLQPGLAIFTDSHFSLMFVAGFEARPALSAAPTDEERGRVFGPFVANAGTYQFQDSILTRKPVVAKEPSVMTGGSFVNRVRLVADSLWIITLSADSVETRAKWVRIERLPTR